MRTYVIRRLLLTIPTLIGVTLIVFFMVRLIPTDIVDMMLMEAEFRTWSGMERGNVERALGLDVPVYVQYFRWVGFIPDNHGNLNGLLQGSFGDSLWGQGPVKDLIATKLPVTVELAILAQLTIIVIAIPIGVYSAVRQDTVGDYAGRSFATALIALPNFWVGLMVILLASLWLGLSPELKPVHFFENPIKNLGQFIIPAFILGMARCGTIMRMTRSMMLEVLRQDYIRTAWAKGLRERVVIIRHALKNALIPVVTLIGNQLRTLIGGAVIIEVVFCLPGLGRLLVDATGDRDYTIVSGVIFVFAAVMILANLLVDLTYGYIDPRVHYK